MIYIQNNFSFLTYDVSCGTVVTRKKKSYVILLQDKRNEKKKMKKEETLCFQEVW